MEEWKKTNAGKDLDANKNDMDRAYQTLKEDSTGVGLKNVIDAISNDPRRSHNVYIAEKTHKRLANGNKTKNGDATAKKFFELAKALYSYSPYFDGANKDKN